MKFTFSWGKSSKGERLFCILKIIQIDIKECHALLVFVVTHRRLFCLRVYTQHFPYQCASSTPEDLKGLGGGGMGEDGAETERRRKM